jgi:heme-degrading monooxygenase HmoA
MSQFIAMNRFKIVPGMESEFEGIWKSRNTYLEDVPGFIRFNLVKGPEREDHVLYASHTLWASGHPDFEGFTIVEGASVG